MPTANLSSYYLMSLPLEHKDIKKVQLYMSEMYGERKKNHYAEINITKFNTEFTSSGYNNRFVEKCGHFKGHKKTHKTELPYI